MRLALAVVIALGSIALADGTPPAEEVIRDRLQNALWSAEEDHYKVAAYFAFDRAGALVGATGSLADHVLSDNPPQIVSNAIDGKATWIASEVALPPFSPTERPPNDARMTALFDGDAKGPLFVHLGEDGIEKPALPTKLERHVDAAAAAAVKKFEATLGDPTKFAKTVSDRNDVVLYGSEVKERYVGGAAVRATLRKWKLALTVRDGVIAGATTSKTVAWVAANVDARAAGKPKAAATPYRVTAIYELHGSSWDIVQLQFSTSL
jgi:SnoaL-like protein